MIAIYKNSRSLYAVALGKLEKKDYQQLLTDLEQHLEQHKDVCLYFEMKDLKGWSASAYWKGIQLNPPNERHLTKVALVGSEQWQEQFTEVLVPFTRAHIKFFGPDEKDMAKEWIQEENIVNGCID